MKKIKKINNDKTLFFEYKDATVLPLKRKNNSWGEGGIIDNRGEYVKKSGYEGWTNFGGKYHYDNTTYLDEEVVWLGNIINHWGHFLVDNVSRLWWLTYNSLDDRKVIYVSDSEQLHPNILRFLELLGINNARLERVTMPITYKNIILPDYSKTISTFSDKYISIFDKVIESIDFKSINSQLLTLSKVYFSRQNFSQARSKEIGEEIIEEFHRSNGFSIIHPESLSLDEQVYIWNKVDFISCLNGTIPLNVCFSRNPNLNLHILNKTSRPHQNLYDFEVIFQKRMVIRYDAFYKSTDKYVKNLGGGPFVLKVTEGMAKGLSSNELDHKFFLKKYKLPFYKRMVFITVFLFLRNIKRIVKYILSKFLNR